MSIKKIFDPITVFCPFCHAKAGEPCTMKPAFGYHFSRLPGPVIKDEAK